MDHLENIMFDDLTLKIQEQQRKLKVATDPQEINEICKILKILIEVRDARDKDNLKIKDFLGFAAPLLSLGALINAERTSIIVAGALDTVGKLFKGKG